MARAWSANFDNLIGGAIRDFSHRALPIDVPGLSKHPDFFAALMILILTGTACQNSFGLFVALFIFFNLIVVFACFHHIQESS